MAATRVEQVTVPGGAYDLTVWLPGSGGGPGVLLVPEIFGVGDYIHAVAEDLTGLGYVVAAPDLFWRLSPGWRAAHDEEGVARSLELGGRLDFEQSVADAAGGLRHLMALPEVARGEATGTAGILGFCLGGSIAYFLAAQNAAAAVVSFYGSEVPGRLDLLDAIECPLQFHFGGSDPYIPRADVAEVEKAVRGRPNAEIHVEEQAGHAFHNRKAPMFHDPEPAARAWHRAEEFLARHLPV
ncbi:dienelactone hydrolase family protein [Actinoallomurus iriomotensis]|uniref:Carboxymethylenebutenolidase n=1 Tax=Actinoallomurus iriomotensis TaxID=478107 RepID=A0A9W6SAB0_9ACTN|nr:dienelactone hydrolase family protein [Actinoallomurus iriomotensis]GLY90244.1 carboxymethylenebutenolidase [Actinoallomurus iriomotensis]